jgi:hypothetical protein
LQRLALPILVLVVADQGLMERGNKHQALVDLVLLSSNSFPVLLLILATHFGYQLQTRLMALSFQLFD